MLHDRTKVENKQVEELCGLGSIIIFLAIYSSTK